jgi:hypothetical protein
MPPSYRALTAASISFSHLIIYILLQIKAYCIQSDQDCRKLRYELSRNIINNTAKRVSHHITFICRNFYSRLCMGSVGTLSHNWTLATISNKPKRYVGSHDGLRNDRTLSPNQWWLDNQNLRVSDDTRWNIASCYQGIVSIRMSFKVLCETSYNAMAYLSRECLNLRLLIGI